jgi:predicted O-methyltransferase YrrM
LDWASLPKQCTDAFDDIMRDKFIALDQDKCELIYHVLRSINAKTVVEAGTSFGVSTIYLALAVAQNVARDSQAQQGRVIATEKEPSKASVARENWERAGDEIQGVIDLRVGDLRETLEKDLGTVDFLLLDSEYISHPFDGPLLTLSSVWTPLALPAVKLVKPYLRPGAVIMADNTLMANVGYEELLAYLDAPNSGFRRVTLPYTGGLDMIIYQ